jgi:hypothetical protein
MVWNEPGPDTRLGRHTDKDNVRDPVQFLPGGLAGFNIWHMFKDMSAKDRPELFIRERKVGDITIDIVATFTSARVNVRANIPASVGFDLKQRFGFHQRLYPRNITVSIF